MPLFSVITPCYNAEKWVSRCVESIVNGNKDVDYEFIILNDGSTDSTRRICENYALKHPQIRLYSRENRGYCATMNELISLSRGQYIVSVDSDNWLSKNALVQLENTIRQHASPDIVQFSFAFFPSSADTQKELGRTNDIILTSNKEISAALRDKKGVWANSHGGKAIARRLFTEDIHFQGDPAASDTIVMEQLLYLASSFLITAEPYLNVEIRNDSLSGASQPNQHFYHLIETELNLLPFYQQNIEKGTLPAPPSEHVFSWFAHSLLEPTDTKEQYRQAKQLWKHRKIVFPNGVKNRIKQWILCHLLRLSRWHVARGTESN